MVPFRWRFRLNDFAARPRCPLPPSLLTYQRNRRVNSCGSPAIHEAFFLLQDEGAVRPRADGVAFMPPEKLLVEHPGDTSSNEPPRPSFDLTPSIAAETGTHPARLEPDEAIVLPDQARRGDELEPDVELEGVGAD